MSTEPPCRDGVSTLGRTGRPTPYPKQGLSERLARAATTAFASCRDFLSRNDPTFGTAFIAAFLVTVVLFMRSPASNFIFDEQEALLANPYLHDDALGVWTAFRRDFWGLPPETTIGSYRPLPNVIWWVLSRISSYPWLLHWANLIAHAVNASLVAGLAFAITRRRRLAWMGGGAFAGCAVLTEAVTGVVGLADVLSGMGILLGVHAVRLRCVWMPLAVFFASLLALFSKESGVLAVPLVTASAVLTSAAIHPDKPRVFPRAVLAALGASAAFVVYIELRRRLFPVGRTADLAPSWLSALPRCERIAQSVGDWVHQPRLPHDSINNPLVEADWPLRIAGALRVYFRGLVQVFLPYRLSGDYSYAQELVPARVFGVESLLGAVALVAPPVVAVLVWLRGRGWRNAAGSIAPLLALGLLWVPAAYFPHSNMVVLLPTVRAERFWYIPAIGAAWLLGMALDRLWGEPGPLPTDPSAPGLRRLRARRGVVVLVFVFQALAARVHALAYTNDLWFWKMTRWASPNSAKAQLNYAVMLGARGRLEERLRVGRRALEIAPKWPMAHVYHADTLCRLGRADEAWRYYVSGWTLAPNEKSLVALGLQCLWDKKQFERRREDLLELGEQHPDSWLDFLVREVLRHGNEHGGVRPEYRPRAYDQGPKTPAKGTP